MSGNREYYPLTHPQKGIWYTEKLYPGTSIGNIAATLKITGDIDYTLLEKAITNLIYNNDSLRLRLNEINEIPMQYIMDYKPKKIDFFDFESVGLDFLYKWDEEQTKTPFELYDSDLFYFAILKIKENEAGIFCKIHHIISDGWSVVHIGNKILNYYNLLRNGEELINEKAPPYTEYILHEQEYLRSDKYKRDEKYWENIFSVYPELTTFKPDSSHKISIESCRKTFVLPVKLSNKIRDFCKLNKISVFGLFNSTLFLYINRVTSRNDLIIGVPVINRSDSKEKETIGMFVNTKPLRITVDEETDFLSFSQMVTREWISILKHQKYPYENILKFVREKYGKIEKLYDISLSYQNAKFVKTNIQESQEGRWHFNHFQTLSLSIHINDREDDGNIILDYDYLKSIFCLKEIEFMHDHMIRLLWHSLDNPYRKISKIEMISEKEKNKILYEFNNTEAEYPIDKTIHKLFEEQVERAPDDTAVIFEDNQLTYRELNEKANQTAWMLRELGVKPDSLVGIIAKQSLEMVVYVLAVLKAGGAYLPIDPELPSNRIEFMLNDCNTEILLVQYGLDISEIKFTGRVVNINDSKKDIVNINNLGNLCNSDNLVYVIYTSGSTGKPKGVMIEHRSLVNQIVGLLKLFDVDFLYNHILLAKFTFDVSIQHIFLPLISGGKLYIPDEALINDPSRFWRYITLNKINILNTVPSLINLMLDNMSGCIKANLKLIMSGGDIFNQELYIKIKNAFPEARIFNIYGPTETTINATIHECMNIKNERSILIGKPLNNYKVYILDHWKNPVPINVPGEMYISGDGLARGYINSAKLTSDKFIDNPFNSSERLYRTGDLGRWYPKGAIEYLGRLDQQVKIRGFRIEIGEIEKALLKFQLVKDAKVIDIEDAFGKKYLCAYIVSQVDVAASEIKIFLSRELPHYMIPSKFVRLDHIPITHNGKIDRKLLCAFNNNDKSGRDDCINSPYEAPRNEVEKKLVQIWSKILGVSNIGINDNFFEIGGDSLSAIQVQTATFSNNWNLSTQDFYNFQTIKSLSAKISGEIKEINTLEKVTRQQISITREFSKNFKFSNSKFNNELKRIFLIGSTGYLGIHILHELMQKTNACIYCLVRGETVDKAISRLSKLLRYYFSIDIGEIINKRLFVFNGDIIYPKFGLNDEVYNYIAQNTGVVIHSAGYLKHYGDFDTFKKVNIDGTAEVVDFAYKNHKALYYMSTLSISGHYLVRQNDKEVEFTENDFYIGQHYEDNVYIQSKFEAEKIVHDAKKYGLDAVIFRLGNLSGRYSDGCFQKNADDNGFLNKIKSIIQLGAVPEALLDHLLDFTPVDCCAEAVVRIICAEESRGRIFHILNKNEITILELINMLIELGFKIESLNSQAFREYIKETSVDIGRQNILSGLINDFNKEMQLDYKTSVITKSDITVKYLDKLEFSWPQVNIGYIRKIIQYLDNIEFFNSSRGVYSL